MELRIEELQLPGKIKFNYEETKAELQERIKTYEGMIVTEDAIKEAKVDRANLNKLKKALNDERIRREKEYMAPFLEFKAQIADLMATIDKPISLIDAQIKSYEEEKKAKKLEAIKEFFLNAGAPEWLRFEQIYDPKWLNATVSIPVIHDAITTRIFLINQDLETLAKLPEFGFEATEVYKTTLSINMALSEGQRLADIQKRKAEAERIRKENEERARAEAAEKAAMEAEIARVAAEEKKEAFPVEEPITAPIEEPKEEPKQWVKFAALLTIEQAKELKAFFADRNIQIKAI